MATKVKTLTKKSTSPNKGVETLKKSLEKKLKMLEKDFQKNLGKIQKATTQKAFEDVKKEFAKKEKERTQFLNAALDQLEKSASKEKPAKKATKKIEKKSGKPAAKKTVKSKVLSKKSKKEKPVISEVTPKESSEPVKAP